MKVKVHAMPDVLSIERILTIDADEDDEVLGNNGELEPGTYAMDNTGQVWRKVETVTELVTQFTENNGIRRVRVKRRND